MGLEGSAGNTRRSGGKAQGRRREGPGRLHRCLCKHRTPVDGLHKHDDVSLYLSYFSSPPSQTFHVTFFFVTLRHRRRHRHGPRVQNAFLDRCCRKPRVHPKMRFGPPQTQHPFQNAPPYYNANKMFCLSDTSLMYSHSSFFKARSRR